MGFPHIGVFSRCRGQLGRTCSTPTAHNGSFGVASVSQSLDIEAYGSVVVGWLSERDHFHQLFAEHLRCATFER